MTPEEILKALDDNMPSLAHCTEAAALIRQLQRELADERDTLKWSRQLTPFRESVHDRDARAAMQHWEPGESVKDASRWAFDFADAMAAERARRAKGGE